MTYAPTVNNGDTRQRIFAFAGVNPLNGAPSIDWHEQEVIKTASGEVEMRPTRVVSSAYDPQSVVTIRNPLTDAPTGATMTHAEALAVIYSLGRAAQLAADAKEAQMAAVVAARETALAELRARAVQQQVVPGAGEG